MHKKVKFQGETYWLNNEGFFCTCLSPLNHFTEDGKLTGEGIVSYAIIENEEIMRYGRSIGKISELEEI